MNQALILTHYYHSGFSAARGRTLLVFDYWRGEHGEIPERLQLTPDQLKRFDHVYVFISHDHPDHLDPVVFTWKDVTDVNYIVASDMPVGTRGRRMAPGDTLALQDQLSVTAFDSTDLGVSFLVKWDGITLFHAGDLNYWHWREESTMAEIEEAEAEFRNAVEPISRESIDIAFFPVDPRQGSMFEAGANYFILSVKPRLLIPMHYFHRADVAIDYARTASCRSTEVIAMPHIGEKLGIQIDEEGYMNLFVPSEQEENSDQADEKAGEETPFLDENADNPFEDSDLPLSQLADESPENTGDSEPS